MKMGRAEAVAMTAILNDARLEFERLSNIVSRSEYPSGKLTDTVSAVENARLIVEGLISLMRQWHMRERYGRDNKQAINNVFISGMLELSHMAMVLRVVDEVEVTSYRELDRAYLYLHYRLIRFERFHSGTGNSYRGEIHINGTVTAAITSAS